MRILIASLIMFTFFMAPPASAKFIGRNNLGICDTMTQLTIFKKKTWVNGDWVDNGTTDIQSGHIWLDAAYLARHSAIVQKFIFQHECGHSHGIRNEVGADTYAFYVLESQLNTKVIKEICATGIPAERCNNLKALLKKK